MRCKNDITAEYVRSILDYDPDTGIFTWRKRHPETFKSTGRNGASRSCAIWNGRYFGKPAGSFYEGNGYINLQIAGRRYLAHRIAWLFVNGEWPIDQIDHKDLNKLNNSISNLRHADYAKNAQNRPIRRDNTSGFKGVRANKSGKTWYFEIRDKEERTRVSGFLSAKDAHLAYLNAANEKFGEYARGNK